MTQKPTTLITGAGKRIGAAIATHLASRGHDLVLHYRHAKTETEQLAATLEKTGTRVALKQADLADTEGLADFWTGLPAVTHLILNASHYAREPFAEFTATQLRTQLAINLEAPLLLSQSFFAQLPANGTVTVLGDGAIGASIGPNFFPYAVSKHAWASVIELLAASLAPRARANLLALAPTIPAAGEDDALFARLAERAPLKRTGTVTEVCQAIDFLLNAPGVTGQILSLANGQGLPPSTP